MRKHSRSDQEPLSPAGGRLDSRPPTSCGDPSPQEFDHGKRPRLDEHGVCRRRKTGDGKQQDKTWRTRLQSVAGRHRRHGKKSKQLDGPAVHKRQIFSMPGFLNIHILCRLSLQPSAPIAATTTRLLQQRSLQPQTEQGDCPIEPSRQSRSPRRVQQAQSARHTRGRKSRKSLHPLNARYRVFSCLPLLPFPQFPFPRRVA